MNKNIIKWEKEGRKEQIKEAKRLKEAKRINEFIYDKYIKSYSGYLFIFALIGAIGVTWFIFGTNTFQDGYMRFAFAVILALISMEIIRNYLQSKIKKKYKIK